MDQQSLKFFQTLQSGDISLSFFKQQAIFLLGMTKRGKTTSGHMLCNQPLKKDKYQAGSVILKPQGKNFLTATIGTSHNSQTQIPNYFQTVVKNKKISIIDCPGYEDTYGCHRTISNAYFRYRVFSKVQKSKFVLVLQSSDLQTDISGLRNTIVSFIETFKNYEKIENDILEATALLITKTFQQKIIQNQQKTIQNQQKTIQNLKEAIIQIVNTYQGRGLNLKMKIHFNTLLTHMVDKKKIFNFPLFDSNKYTDTNSTVLQQIDKSTKFWERQTDPNSTVDMKLIEFNVIQQIQKHRNQKQYWDKFKKILITLQAKYRSVLKEGIQQTLNTIFQDAKGKQQSRKFMEIINKVTQNYYQYDQRFDNQRKKVCKKLFQDQKDSSLRNIKNIQIRKFAFTDKIQKVFKKFVQATEKQFIMSLRTEKFLEFVKQNILYLYRSLKYLGTTKDQTEILFPKFFYVIFRMLEQLKIFFILLKLGQPEYWSKQRFINFHDFPEFIRPLKQVIDNLNAISLKQSKKDFIMLYQSENPKQYEEIKKFIAETQRQNQFQSQRLKIKQMCLSISLSQKKCLSQLTAQEVFEKINKLNQARQYFQVILCQSAQQNHLSSKQIDTVAQNLIFAMKILGQTMEYFKLLQQALICFKSIKDVFKVIEVYQLLVKRLNTKQNKRKILMEFGQYAFSHCRRQLGISKLQQAFSYSKSIQELDEVSDSLQYFVCQQREKIQQKYISAIRKSGYYQPISREQSVMLKAIKISDLEIYSPIKKSSSKKITQNSRIENN